MALSTLRAAVCLFAFSVMPASTLMAQDQDLAPKPGAGFTIFHTNDIHGHLTGKFTVPIFTSIRAKKEFTESFIERCVVSI